ncbi:Mechanosensitive ion channel domain containing protein [Elaphomyces granulatus]
MSGRPGFGEKRLSGNKFHQLPEDSHSVTMGNPNDATIDIPLAAVASQNLSDAQKSNPYQSLANTSNPNINEKEDYHPHASGHRRRRTVTAGSLEESEEGTLTRMGKIYKAILDFSVITRYLIYVSPIALIIAVPIIIGATVSPNARIGGVKIAWFFTWVEVVWLALWVSKIFAHFLPYIFQFLCGIVSSGTRKYALILHSLEIAVSLVGWCVLSAVTFLPVMTLNPNQKAMQDTGIKDWEQVVYRILLALLICSLIYLAEKTLVQLISVSYHRKQYTTRIKESKRNIYLLGQLYEASRSMFPEDCREFQDEDAIISDSILLGAKAGKHHTRSGSATPMRLIQNVSHNVGRFGDKLTSAVGNVAQEITGKHVFNPTASHSIVVQALEKKRSCEALARRIFMSFVVDGKDSLYVEDLVEILGSDREAEAEECFKILDRDGNGDVSLEEMILTVAEFGRVRKSIARSMHDVDQAIDVLDTLLVTLAVVVMILVFISFVTTGAATIIAAGATTLLSLSFVFAATAQEVLGSCIFLFVKHPFDVGDRVEIAKTELFVEEVSLLYTVFRTVADQRVTQVPNVVLNSNWIDNITRSKSMKERIKLAVDFGTTFADIQLLKAEMVNFVCGKDNCRDFHPEIDVELTGVGDMDQLELRFEIRHKSNWSNESVRAARRSKLMCALVLAIRKLPIYAPGGASPSLGDPGNPSYSVAISDDQAQLYRDKAKDDKESKRMIPTNQLQDLTSIFQSEGGRSTGIDIRLSSGVAQPRGSAVANAEAAVVEALNTRPPAFDTSRADESDQLHRTPSVASAMSRKLDDDRAMLLRAPSTGRRKEGSVAMQTGPIMAGAPAVNTPTDPEARTAFPSRNESLGYHPATVPQASSLNPNNPFTKPQQTRSYLPSQHTPPLVQQQRPEGFNAFPHQQPRHDTPP